MSIELDERLRRLGEFAISEPRPVELIEARGQQIRRRRRVLAAAFLLVLLVGTVAGVATVLGSGDDRVHVASFPQGGRTDAALRLAAMSYRAARASARASAARALERSAVVGSM